MPPQSPIQALYRVMLVENDAGAADLVHAMLGDAAELRFEIHPVTTLAAALQQLPLNPYDVLLLDLALPDSSGVDTIHAIRRIADNLPLIVLTEHDDMGAALQAISAGAQDYLAKGKFDREILVRAIRYAISRQHRQSLAREQADTEAYRKLTAQVFETMADGIMVTDTAANIQAVNPAFCRITGYTETEVLGKNSRLLKSDRHETAFYTELWDTLQSRGEWAGEIWNRRKDGEEYPEWQTISSIKDASGQVDHYVAVFADLSGIHRSRPAEDKLSWYDSLTGLANRAQFLKRLGQTAEHAQREGCFGVAILLDLDRFKAINEARGLAVGNALLKRVARVLTRALHSEDLLARLDSDEFAILLPRLAPTREEAAKDALVVAEKIRIALQKRLSLNGETFHIDTSIGIAVFPETAGETASDILRQADMAMHRAKTEGGSRIIFFKAVMGETIKERYRIERELRHAITRNQLRMFVQPQWEGGSKPVGVEALIRWEHPQRGLIPPGMFIPLAETSDLIVAVDRWMLDAVCQLLGRLERDEQLTRVSVNISPRHFQQPDFVEEVKRKLSVSGADPAHLVLEVTEGLVIGDFADVIAKMTELRTLGVHFSMDDFGTGYSSLAYLKRLPIHEIKIDKSFIQDITTNPNDAAWSNPSLPWPSTCICKWSPKA
jgi:diguanylate cyclase (GGDEF)-like protein/PAS domain S-box-containing protein